MRRVDEYEMNRTEKAEFIYCNVGPAMIHNYLCAVCKTNSAVQNCNVGHLMPCLECQLHGWRTVKVGGLLKRLVDWATNPAAPKE